MLPSTLIPKLSTTRVKVMGLHTFFHSPGVNCVGWYLALGSLFFSRSWAIFPACGNPYIPFTILMQTHPFSSMSFSFYFSMISCGVILNGNLMYSGLYIGVPR